MLATVHMWTLCHPKTLAVPMILSHFVAADVFDSMCELSLSVGADKPGGHRNTADRSAGELYAGELYDIIVTLAETRPCQRLWCPAFPSPWLPFRPEMRSG